MSEIVAPVYRLCAARARQSQLSRTEAGPLGLVACVAATLVPGSAGAAEGDGYSREAKRADQQFATYGFAHEFGSGVYDFQGRTLQVYTLPIGWTAREVAPGKPGIRLKLPVTLGFLDFRTSDVVSTGLPENVDSISFVPGIEFRFELPHDWSLAPYVQAGASVADERDVETRLFGAGLRAERVFEADGHPGFHASELIYSGVRYRGDLPSDDLVRLRNGVQVNRKLEQSVGGRLLQLGLFSVVDVFLDPPTGPATGIDVPIVQLEAGFVFGTSPPFEIWGVPVPRVGLSYRFAGDLSTLRFVVGAPF